MPEPTALELFALDVDARLLELWQTVGEVSEDELGFELLGAAMRAAYTHGYCDALRECGRASGELYRERDQREREARGASS